MKKKIYIILFVILYLIVAFSSLWHSIEFFALANITWMAVILAGAFEIGQAAVLFALLSNTKDRKKVMPWVLMSVFTLVQVLGNVYASYKHIMLNSVDNLKYFKEPVFIWTDLPDAQATVIVTYLVGSVLPISALLLTSMLTSFLNDEENDKQTKAATPMMITDSSPEPIVVNETHTEQTIETPVAENDVVNETTEDIITETIDDTSQMINDTSQMINDTSLTIVENEMNENKKATHLVSL